MSAYPTCISKSTLVVIILARIGLFLLLALLSVLISDSNTAFYALMAIAFCITIPHALWLRSRNSAVTIASTQFLLDLLVVSLLVYFTGGLQSRLILLYPLVILSAGIAGTEKQAIKTTILGILVYALMASLLLQDLIIQCLPAQGTTAEEAHWPGIILRSFLFALFGIAGIFIAKQCGFRTGHQQTSATLNKVLLAIPTPVFLLNSDGIIILANEAACELIDRQANELSTLKFTDLLSEGPIPIPDSYGQSGYLARNHNRRPLPVAYSSVDFEKMNLTVHAPNEQHNTVQDATLIVLTNLSHSLKLEHTIERIEQVTAATRLAGEMAHEIRTPLTSISASIQLLKHYEEQATATDWLPNSRRRRDREELFLHIEDASRQLNSVIQNFVDFAEFTPEDLLSIIKLDSAVENHGYIGHLNTIGRDLRNGKNTDSGRRSNYSELVE